MTSRTPRISSKTPPYRIERLYFKVGSSALNEEGETLLHLAVFANNLRAVQTLIDLNFDVNARNGDGATPLFDAMVFDYDDIGQLLIANGADVNARDSFGNSALHGAAIAKSIKCAAVLLDKGADVNAQNVNKMSPIFFATSHYGVVQLLLQRGADAHVVNIDGNSVLHFAAYMFNQNTFSLLLDRGLSLELRNHAGESVWDLTRNLPDDIVTRIREIHAARGTT
jgi:ankyrin repeat protein